MWCCRHRSILLPLVLTTFLPLSGCKPDESPFRAENDLLKKQLARQESLVTSLQDGNKVMQQQLDKQLIQARKLTADIKKTAVEQAAQSIQLEQKGAQFEDLPRPLNAVTKTVEEALARNGYQVKVSIKADQKAVIVTDRKVSNPASLEVAGFRNQYVIAVQAQPLNVTRLSVKAEFEKLAQGGRILSVSAEETAEIERRLIGEVSKALSAPSKT